MTKVVIIGEMTLGESFAPPGFPGSPGHLPAPQPPGVTQPPGVSPPIVLPPSPDQGLPSIPGVPLPPIALPPGEIWPPLPPGTPEPHKLVAIVAIPGVGYRYTVVELKPGQPDQGLPGHRPGTGHPDQGLPDEPTPEPKHRR